MHRSENKFAAMEQRQYIAIDLKSFYASVECVERGLDPLDACLVVADRSRTDRTICLAVSPPLKALGVPGRPRLFEAVNKVREINYGRGRCGCSSSARELAANPDLAVDFIVASPRMALYLEYSTRIYNIYLQFVAEEDIHIYSVDEVFIDATPYLKTYKTDAHGLAMMMIRSVLAQTGITATAGIGSNMYLCKVAMDIVAKKMPPDKDGVRIAELTQQSYRQKLWNHTPLTDFWRIGHGTAERLARHGIFTMGEIARCSMHNERLLYQLFGINAELLIDHAWGWEPVTMELVKAYRPQTSSLSSGQVLIRPYSNEEAANVLLEMIDVLALDLVDKMLLTTQIVLHISYANDAGHAHGTTNTNHPTSSYQILSAKMIELFRRITNPQLRIRRLNISLNKLQSESTISTGPRAVQPDLFSDYQNFINNLKHIKIESEKEHHRQQAVLHIKKRFGKNSILKGINYATGATQRERNNQIGGHHI